MLVVVDPGDVAGAFVHPLPIVVQHVVFYASLGVDTCHASNIEGKGEWHGATKSTLFFRGILSPQQENEHGRENIRKIFLSL